MSDGLTITRTFDAPPRAVFDAWTRPEQFAVWFGTEAVSVPLETVSMDVRVGGAWSAVMHLPDGGPRIDWVGEYTEVAPPGRLAFTMTDDASAPAGDPVTVDIVAAGDGAEMTLHQSGHGMPPEQLEATRAGYDGFFDAMAGVLAAQR